MQAMASVASIAPVNVHRLATSRRICARVGTVHPPAATCSTAAKPGPAAGGGGAAGAGGRSTRGAVRRPLSSQQPASPPQGRRPAPPPPFDVRRRHAEPLLIGMSPFDAQRQACCTCSSLFDEGPSLSFIVTTTSVRRRSRSRSAPSRRRVRPCESAWSGGQNVRRTRRNDAPASSA